MAKFSNTYINRLVSAVSGSKRVQSVIILLFFIAISLVFFRAIFKNFDNWGIGDWDQFLFYNAVARQTILTFHQFPLWNPYYCGGNIMLANPQYNFLSPLFVSVLAFGALYGLKILIVAYAVIGLSGFYLLSRHLKFGKLASITSASIFMLSAVYVLQIREGHIGHFAMAWLPWIFLFYLKSYKSPKFAIPAGILLAFVFFEDHGYLFVYYSLFLSVFSLFKFLKERNFRIFFSLFVIFAFALMISAIKLIPVASFLNNNPYTTNDSTGFTYDSFVAALTGTNGDYYFPNQLWGWQEFGAYIGIIAVSLALLGTVLSFKKNWPLVFTAIFFIILSFNQNFQNINLWQYLHTLPVFDSFRVVSRFIVIVVFSAAILAGEALTRLERKHWLIAFALLLVILTDLISINSQQTIRAFSVTPVVGNSTQMFYQIDTQGGTANRFSTMYDIFLQNKGTVNCYEPIHVDIHAVPKEINGKPNSDYRGEVYLANNNGYAFITYFSPNRIDVNLQATANDTLVLNQNFYSGWKVSDGTTKNAVSFNGLISTAVTPNDKQITFYYSPNYFFEGAAATVFGILLAILLLKKNYLQKIGEKFDRTLEIPKIKFDKKMLAKLRLAIITLIVILSVYQIAKSTQLSNWSYNETANSQWFQNNFNYSDWNKFTAVPIYFENDVTIPHEYIRGTFATNNPESAGIGVFADDCIQELYVNGNQIYENSNCGACTDCKWVNFDLSGYANKGNNTVAIKIFNVLGGPIRFQVRTADKYDVTLVIAALVVALILSFGKPLAKFYKKIFPE